ncbi:MAG TPA: phosphoglycerate mutase family protein [Ilumatobacter sp.]|nr:phosphoglycerate mutase family protein [Ilumatobacter sp.]
MYLVRHAKAGDRNNWDGDDSLRPLTEAGREQAERLADTFARLPPTRLLSSPYVRCVETLQPTAERVGIAVETSDALAEGQPWEDVLALVDGLPDDTVLCTHGDLVPAVIAALERRGADVRTTPDWRKAATWVLERDTDGRITALTAWPPP